MLTRETSEIFQLFFCAKEPFHNNILLTQILNLVIFTKKVA